MKVLVATGHDELDNVLKQLLPQHEIEVVGDCFNRTVICDVVKEVNADTVIISSLLQGEEHLVSVIKNLREYGIRVVVLPGSLDMDKTKELVIALVPYGVYDFVYDELTPEDIVHRLKNIATLKDVPNSLVKTAMEKQNVGKEIEGQFHKQFKVAKNKSIEQKQKKNIKSQPTQKNIILLATGDDAINEAISTSSTSCETIMVNSREELVKTAVDIEPAVIIMSPALPGDMDILEVAYQIKQVTDKILFISWLMPSTDITLIRIKELGINVLSGNINIGTILKTICRLMGNTENECTLTQEDDTEEYSKEGTLFRIAKVGSEIAKNIPSVSIPKIQINKKQTKINDKVLAVVSSVPAGKTFISVNLGTVLAQLGYRVVLVDGETLQQSTHTWLNMPQNECGIIDALGSDDPLMYGYQHSIISNLYILNNDPQIEKTPTNVRSFEKMINKLNNNDDVDIIIIDTYRNLIEPITKTAIEMAARVILVADMDFSHLIKLQTDLDKLENALDFNKFSLLVNRNVVSNNLFITDAESAVGLQAEGVIPEKATEVLESIKSGIPVALFCPEIKEVFEGFWNRNDQFSELA